MVGGATLAIAGLAIWSIASLVYRVLELRELGRFGRGLRAPSAPRANHERPAITLVRPLCGAPDYLEDTLGSLFRAADTEAAPVQATIELTLASADDPAHAVVDALRARFPKVPVELHSGKPWRSSNRKIANLLQIESLRSPPGERGVVVLSDADIEVPCDYVAKVAEAFADPAVGFASAAYRSVPASTLASRFDAHLQNLYFLPSTCLSVALEGLNFGMGSTLAVRERALAEIGGLSALANEAADDGRLAKLVFANGWRGEWLPMLVDHRLAEVGWRAALARHLRCARATRSLRPVGFLGLVLVTHGWLPALLAGALLPGGGAAAIALPLLWWLVVAACQWPRRREIPLEASDLALGPLLDLAVLAIQLAAHFGEAEGPPPLPLE